MQRDGGGALLLRDQAGVEEGLMLLVDPDPGLDGHRHAELVRGTHRLPHDGAQPVPLVGQHAPAALAGDLRHRAAEVEVDVADGEVPRQDPGRIRHHAWVDAVELDRACGLARVELKHGVGLGVADHEAAGGDHLADVEPGTLFAAQLPVGGVRDPGHRREDHGKLHDDGVAAAGRVQAQRLDHGQQDSWDGCGDPPAYVRRAR